MISVGDGATSGGKKARSYTVSMYFVDGNKEERMRRAALLYVRVQPARRGREKEETRDAKQRGVVGHRGPVCNGLEHIIRYLLYLQVSDDSWKSQNSKTSKCIDMFQVLIGDVSN